ncbi:MAG: MurR/RpiR family transcriptional regulator [Polaromonas sp.]
MTAANSAPAHFPTPITFEDYRAAILDGRFKLSRRLSEAARYVLDHPTDSALHSVNKLAAQAAVSPSTFIRLAQAMGYQGFSEMQQVLQEPLANASRSYGERIRHSRGEQVVTDTNDSASVLREFSQANLVSLEFLRDNVANVPIEEATELLLHADRIHVIGLRRSFPIAVYLSYALNRIGCRAFLMDGIGGALAEQSMATGPQDLLLAISFPPYAESTVETCRLAHARGLTMLALTDNLMSPIAPYASIVLEVNDAELLGFRSLTASMDMAQSLVIGTAFKLRDKALKSGLSTPIQPLSQGSVDLSDINC